MFETLSSQQHQGSYNPSSLMCFICNRLLVTQIPLVACQCTQLEGKSSDMNLQRNIFSCLNMVLCRKLLTFTLFIQACFVLLCLQLKGGLSRDYFLFSLLKNTVNIQERQINSQLKEKFPQAVFIFFSISHNRSIVFFIARQRKYNLLLYYWGFLWITFSMYSAVYISHVHFSKEYVKHMGFGSQKWFNFSFSYAFSIKTEISFFGEGIFL